MGSKKKKRKCSRCLKSGHNARTCNSKKTRRHNPDPCAICEGTGKVVYGPKKGDPCPVCEEESAKLKLCAWCQLLEATPGDIYCEACRSAVVRQRETGNEPSEFESYEYDIDLRRNPLDICKHCGKYSCDCTRQFGSLFSPDLTTDPRAISCECGQMLYPGEICNCQTQKYRHNPDDLIELENGQFGWDYIIRDLQTGKSILIQTDYDYPGTAMTFGWVPTVGPGNCEHSGTDGTVDCARCGRTASEFINEAHQYLDDHIGDQAEDPGYFLED